MRLVDDFIFIFNLTVHPRGDSSKNKIIVFPSCLMQSFMHCMTLAAFEGVPKFETDKVKMDNIAIKSKRWLINASLSYK